MPDHLRQPKNAMGPRSPAGSDSPLSSVIGRGRSADPMEHPLIHNKTPPPPPLYNPGSSSGFSSSSSPNDSPRPQEDSEQPLSLVVRKYDSGHDTGEEYSRSPEAPSSEETKENSSLKIKAFAKFSLGEDARDKVPQHTEQTLLAALTAPPKSKPAHVQLPASVAVETPSIVCHDVAGMPISYTS